jgi:dynein heavy chain
MVSLDIKNRVTTVRSKLEKASETRATILEKRDAFRPVATRGSLLYFSMADVGAISPMYQSSLRQFIAIFQRSLAAAERSAVQKQRIANIAATMTRLMVAFVSRGLFQRHKLCFKVLVLLKMLLVAGKVTHKAVNAMLRGTTARAKTGSEFDTKCPAWMSSKVRSRVTLVCGGGRRVQRAWF